MTSALLLLAGDPARLSAALAGADLSWADASWAGVRADDDPLATTGYGARTPFNGVVDVEVGEGAADALALGLQAVLDALGDSVDRGATAVVAGRTHRIIDGRTDVALAYSIHRVAALTPQQYGDHWLHRHGPLAKELVPTSGYEQIHAAPDAGTALAAQLGLGGEQYDGVAMCFFGERQDFVDMLEARERSLDMNRIYEDELRFLDHSRSCGALVRRVQYAVTGSTPATPVVLVTGALGGIGSGVVADLATQGYRVIATDRREDDSTEWLEEMHSRFGTVVQFEPLDVTSEEDVSGLAARLADDGVEVSHLVLAHAAMIKGDVWDLPMRHWELVLRVNLHGSFLLCRAFTKPMVDRGFGRVVTFTSVWAYQPGDGQVAYASAKAGITGLTRALAHDLARHDVTVNAVCPGLVWHERLRGVSPDSVIDAQIAATPAGRAGDVDEAAALVRFLLSDGASFVNGQVIHLNGGEYMTG